MHNPSVDAPPISFGEVKRVVKEDEHKDEDVSAAYAELLAAEWQQVLSTAIDDEDCVSYLVSSVFPHRATVNKA